MDKKDYWIIWTVYFDSSKSRSFGRKVPSSMAVRSPTIEELVKAVSNLGLEFEVHADKRHPGNWFEGPHGCVVIKKRNGVNKRKLVLMIAKELIRIRQSIMQVKGA
ncbi:signal recognition particle subunit SRP19/SEC65 family protein [Vulcanisaeta souniana]|uniref:Signal recognition particle 19 kDa protein n=1 Tax=Vulcanisaeta souniana JCM 11219 TaxID=1293586 RepID=A0A830EJK2_9CREN|nr:signal recognition particle subunit SRP19/SEC65 family protein [Vulcanisaeta souniana]BDR93062.1 hypothetical protein Vsou_21550 [Vulcanisaeta souniana JCM 11219]GGI83194.1 hypothetical protein GCM10007112_19990 [Vulcanisaeta souniana JCM 11219]